MKMLLSGIRKLASMPRRKSKQEPPFPEPEPAPVPMASNRHHNLTPSSSHESLVLTPHLSSPFFANLSAELRIAILTAAFGNRTLHIHLHEEQAPQTKPRKRESRPWRRNVKAVEQPTPRPKLTGHVCRRIHFSKDGQSSYDPGLFNDYCYSFYTRDPALPEDLLAWIEIGAMGWLLSCRQAYIEGMDILFTTNTFHIASRCLAANLPIFILPQRLKTIRTLELALEWGRYDRSARSRPFDAEVCSIFTQVPAQFPRLTKLSIAFQDNLYYVCSDLFDVASQEHFAPWMEKTAFPPIDEMVKALAVLHECRVYFTSSVRWSLRNMDGLEVVQDEGRAADVWRDLGEGKGYWICEGRDDTPRPVCGLAFS